MLSAQIACSIYKLILLSNICKYKCKTVWTKIRLLLQEQSAPTGAVWSGSTMFVAEASKSFKQMTKQVTFCDWSRSYMYSLPFMKDCGRNPKYCASFSTSVSIKVTSSSSVAMDTESAWVTEELSADTDMVGWNEINNDRWQITWLYHLTLVTPKCVLANSEGQMKCCIMHIIEPRHVISNNVAFWQV